jgi:hypothetical protein
MSLGKEAKSIRFVFFEKHDNNNEIKNIFHIYIVIIKYINNNILYILIIINIKSIEYSNVLYNID